MNSKVENLCDHLLRKYGTKDTETNPETLFVCTTGEKTKKIEFVGEDKINKWQMHEKLTTASIESAEFTETGDLDSNFPMLKSLTLISVSGINWNFIEDILKQLNKLEDLTVSNIKFDSPIPLEFGSKSNLKNLSLCSCSLKWTDIQSLSAMPNLESLTLTSNLIDVIEIAEKDILAGGFKQLKSLYLDQNSISDWNEILKLSALPHLSQLFLTSNKITQIRFPEEPYKIMNSSTPTSSTFTFSEDKYFSQLEELWISNNLINDWESIYELNKLPLLSKLRISHNPIMLRDPPSHLTLSSGTSSSSSVPSSSSSSSLSSSCSTSPFASSSSMTSSQPVPDDVTKLWAPPEETEEMVRERRLRVAVFIVLSKVTVLNGSKISSYEKRKSMLRRAELKQEAKEKAENAKEDALEEKKKEEEEEEEKNEKASHAMEETHPAIPSVIKVVEGESSQKQFSTKAGSMKHNAKKSEMKSDKAMILKAMMKKKSK
ncbi:putative tubulin-folding cofactor E [Monocercomonoides exilis]|uniref:putative tubulin-folding cofactor E n=1 Tax=Monocercomonoides exilis TaxID=2049356 RepID=UPI00355AA0E4|nr:putative tubulin-folding cofactor E [Monocercomonoides exilis]